MKLDPSGLNPDTLEEFVKEFESKRSRIFEDLERQEKSLEKIKSFDPKIYKSLKIEWYFDENFDHVFEEFLKTDF